MSKTEFLKWLYNKKVGYRVAPIAMLRDHTYELWRKMEEIARPAVAIGFLNVEDRDDLHDTIVAKTAGRAIFVKPGRLVLFTTMDDATAVPELVKPQCFQSLYAQWFANKPGIKIEPIDPKVQLDVGGDPERPYVCAAFINDEERKKDVVKWIKENFSPDSYYFTAKKRIVYLRSEDDATAMMLYYG